MLAFALEIYAIRLKFPGDNYRAMTNRAAPIPSNANQASQGFPSLQRTDI